MKTLIMTLVLFVVGSCAHHDESVEHHHHHTCEKKCDIKHKKDDAFNKHCAYSVAEGELGVMGSEEFMINHKGRNYYFSSKNNMEKFRKNVQTELVKANENWGVGRHR